MIHSAGIICFDITDNDLEVFLAHSTGNFPYWSFPKGHVEEGELLHNAAIREFKEETSYNLPYSPNGTRKIHYLGGVATRKDKTVHAFASWCSKSDLDPKKCFSNTCEFPVGSGKMIPELDEYRWVDIKTAYEMINPKQVPLLEELEIVVKAYRTAGKLWDMGKHVWGEYQWDGK